CGHLVRDLDSMGGTKKENVVICLESPRIHQAIREYIRANIPEFHKNRELLYNIMAYELMYICYCDRSRQMFHQWLEKKHGSIGAANQRWGTKFATFAEVVPPPVKNSRPLDGTNRAVWYDWTRFNQDRFTDYLLWVRAEIRKVDSSVPLAAGGSSSMLAGRTGTTGIDEERIVNEVDDVIIHEGGGSTMGMDLQLALSDRRKPLADPEMSLGTVDSLLPHFLHGKSVAQLFHWPSQPANEYYSNDQSSLAHSWNYPLPDIGELLRTALDVRRLNKEIAAFVDMPSEVAILYSQTSTLQLPPEMLTWQVTPYLAELHKAYAASQFLDTKITFVTERQALNGKLSRFKLLLVPGVRNLPAEVVERLWDYASQGGHILILPESLLGDEYNMPRKYLAQLGVSIQATERPAAAGSGRMVQGYDQSFSQNVTFGGGTAVKLRAETPAWPELETAGVRQAIAASAPAKVIYRYPDGKPALVTTTTGKGTILYSTASLENQGYARLLDRLMSEAGVSRPVRAQAAGERDKWNVEVRYARAGERRLAYVSNFNSSPVRLRLEAAPNGIQSVTELRESISTRGNQISVPGRQTNIYELFE
ncbi:MAG: beta-galactosidase, partial [Acidobacteria bacterium]|nr:beta-galactosidase [Acidobacteriota bacterium]